MKNFTYEVRMHADDKQRLHGRGITYGYGDAAMPVVVKLGKRHVVGRIASRSDWGSVGLSATNPAQWFLWAFKPLEPNVFQVTEVLAELEPGRHWRQTREYLLERFNQLEGDSDGSV